MPEARDNLRALDRAFLSRALPSELGVGLAAGRGLSLNALVGLTAMDDGQRLPVTSWGAGTRRLASLEIAAANQSGAQRRTWARPTIPASALSTVHKAKGLERDSVLIMPCDEEHFAKRLKDRCAMYVAVSRAIRELTLIVPRTGWTPLFKVDP